MQYYEASPVIASSPEAVWAVLTDGAAWPSWESGGGRLDGQISPGEKITIRSQAAPGRAFPVKVTNFDPSARLRFSGGIPLGLFGGVRTFEVSPDGTGGTAFRVREEYTGPLLALIWPSMPDLGPSSGRFAQGLKRRAETGR
ncbi:MAG TPA: SRPBCC domain-containing protein [Streptosporangiaceae bacterium]